MQDRNEILRGTQDILVYWYNQKNIFWCTYYTQDLLNQFELHVKEEILKRIGELGIVLTEDFISIPY